MAAEEVWSLGLQLTGTSLTVVSQALDTCCPIFSVPLGTYHHLHFIKWKIEA